MSEAAVDFEQALGRLSIKVRHDVPARQLTTMAAGVPVPRVAVPEDERSVAGLLALFSSQGIPWKALGAGSNVILPDEPLQPWVIKLGKGLAGVNIKGSTVSVGAAAPLMTVARQCSQAGLSGLEFAGGIPATVGGATFMNAGAHGGEFGERVRLIRAVSETGEFVEIKGGDLPWRYRHSGLPTSLLVLGVELELVEGSSSEISELLAHNLAERKKRQPLTFPSSGSVFKNPSPERYAGQLIEGCGLKGYRIGGAIISELHANWIINPDLTARASEIIALIALCKERVQERYNLPLEAEVRMWDSTY